MEGGDCSGTPQTRLKRELFPRAMEPEIQCQRIREYLLM